MRARENPFRTERIGSLAFRQPGLSLGAIRERLAELGGRGAIVGPMGSGKTTLLRELGSRLANEGLRLRHRFLQAESPHPPTRELVREARALGPRDALLFDGAGHLPRMAFWRVERAWRRAGAVLITSHGAGRLPTLVETATDAALLRELAHELLGEPSRALAPLLEELRAAHAGNLRDVFLALYDLAAHDDPRLAELVQPQAEDTKSPITQASATRNESERSTSRFAR
ncbi:MAG: hypothetical protein QNK04_29855 [Myxococcota bacterium]|nr:hypothetical protein [Myxococcota bacterium]